MSKQHSGGIRRTGQHTFLDESLPPASRTSTNDDSDDDIDTTTTTARSRTSSTSVATSSNINIITNVNIDTTGARKTSQHSIDICILVSFRVDVVR